MKWSPTRPAYGGEAVVAPGVDPMRLPPYRERGRARHTPAGQPERSRRRWPPHPALGEPALLRRDPKSLRAPRRRRREVRSARRLPGGGRRWMARAGRTTTAATAPHASRPPHDRPVAGSATVTSAASCPSAVIASRRSAASSATRRDGGPPPAIRPLHGRGRFRHRDRPAVAGLAPSPAGSMAPKSPLHEHLCPASARRMSRCPRCRRRPGPLALSSSSHRSSR